MTAAVMLHAVIVLFGGLLLTGSQAEAATTAEVDLLAAPEAEKDDPQPEEPDPPLDPQEEPPPDAATLQAALEPPGADEPELAAMSLSAIAQALDGAGGADFGGGSADLQSGGRIGGTGKATTDREFEKAFTLAEIDQPPRPLVQVSPAFPPAMRGRHVEGLASVLFLVDQNGAVSGPRIERSSHQAFEQPALVAIRQWKFEPAIKGGRRVGCHVRQQFRFPGQ